MKAILKQALVQVAAMKVARDTPAKAVCKVGVETQHPFHRPDTNVC